MTRKRKLPGELLVAVRSAMVELSATYKKQINVKVVAD